MKRSESAKDDSISKRLRLLTENSDNEHRRDSSQRRDTRRVDRDSRVLRDPEESDRGRRDPLPLDREHETQYIGRGRGYYHRVRGRGGHLEGDRDSNLQSGSNRGGCSRGRGGSFGAGFDGSGRGRGRGSGRGRVRGRGGIRDPRAAELARHDLVQSRTVDTVSKTGTSGKRQLLISNYFAMTKKPDWNIFNYRVDFDPPEERTFVKKTLLRPHAASLGVHIFDGSSLYVCVKLSQDPMRLHSQGQNTEKTTITIRLVDEVAPTDSMYIQILNIIVRSCLMQMGLENLGRHFYDHTSSVRLDGYHLELWPGYKTTIRPHEHQTMLGVEITHKVLRTDTCLDAIRKFRNNPRIEDFRRRVHNEIVGTIVITHYNRKTYRIDDIDWEQTPESSFESNGNKLKFSDYFRDKYQAIINDLEQPLLVSRPKKKDRHRGMTGNILLIPELCQMTGLTDSMRENFQLMQEVSNVLNLEPTKRVNKIQEFVGRINRTPAIQDTLEKWGIGFDDELAEVKGRILSAETLKLGDLEKGHRIYTLPKPADWTELLKGKPMLKTITLDCWVIIVPSRDRRIVDQMTRSIRNVAGGLAFRINEPKEVICITEARPQNYFNAITQAISTYKESLQLIFVIVPNKRLDNYAAIKKCCCVDYGIPSQVFQASNAQKNNKSIISKLVIQMNSKLGGEPWNINFPKNLMVVGFDVHHDGKRRADSVGAIVASTNTSVSKFYSTVSFHNSLEELSKNMCTDITKCFDAYREANKKLPKTIVMFRDGVSEGQLSIIYNTELSQIKQAIQLVYGEAEFPSFVFVVVTKKISTRLFVKGRGGSFQNPEPGTVADDVVTLPERYDFFLVSSSARRGSISPTSYNVLFDTWNLTPDRIHLLVHKLTHMYYNSSATIAVPALCQYARKLAYLSGAVLNNSSDIGLSNRLHYL